MMKWWHLVFLLVLTSCAGQARSCASCSAERFGGNWMVAQYSMDGTPIMCWKLTNTSIDNEPHSDGIYWLDDRSGNLVHLSGWYNRVQVDRGDWGHAAANLGVSEPACKGGKYVAPEKPKAKAKPDVEQEEAEEPNRFPGIVPGD